MSSIKPLIALALTGIASALIVSFKVPSTPAQVAAAPTASASTTTAAAASGPSVATSTTASATPAPTSTSSTASSARYADGTYTGSAVSEPWGTFEVQATISGGQITAVTLVSSPSDRHSSQINSYAVPQLTQEAVAAQSAAVDGISGATWTSQSYETSLQAALDAAAAARQNAG